LITIQCHKVYFFFSNVWWIAVNYGEGKRSQVYLYDGSAISNGLSDEVAIGDQKIGFLYVLNGLIYISYDDKSSVGFCIGFINGLVWFGRLHMRLLKPVLESSEVRS
jgi:hypothetical protein